MHHIPRYQFVWSVSNNETTVTNLAILKIILLNMMYMFFINIITCINNIVKIIFFSIGIWYLVSHKCKLQGCFDYITL